MRWLALFALPLLGGCFGGGGPEEPEVEPSPSLLYNAVALEQLEAGRLTAARVELDKAQREAELRDDLPGRAACWNNRGLVHGAQAAVLLESANDVEGQRRELLQALGCHRRALRLHSGVRERARTLEHMATVHLALKDPATARQHLDEAAGLRDGLADEAGRASHLLVQAAADAAEGRWEAALARAGEAAVIGQSLARPSIRAAALANMADVHAATGRYDAARENLEAALALDRDAASVGAIATDLSRLRGVCEKAGDTRAAIDYGLREAALRLQLARAQQLESVPPTQARIVERLLAEIEGMPNLDREGYEGDELTRLRGLLGGIIPGEANPSR